MSLHELIISLHLDKRSTWKCKVKEQIDFERGHIAFEVNKEVERIKNNKHLMELDNKQPDQQYMISQCFSQQHGKPSFHWKSVGQLG